MAGLTKAEREKREQEAAEQIRQEIEEKIRAEYEQRFKEQTSSTVAETVKIGNKQTRKMKIPLDTLVPVRSGFDGLLTYVSRKTGYTVNWSEINAIEYLEVSELVAMRNGAKAFYENNWIYLGDADEYTSDELYSFLQVARYYKNSLTEEEIDGLFDMSIVDIKEIVGKCPSGVKESIASMAKKIIDELPMTKIKALEEVLDVELNSSF